MHVPCLLLRTVFNGPPTLSHELAVTTLSLAQNDNREQALFVLVMRDPHDALQQSFTVSLGVQNSN